MESSPHLGGKQIIGQRMDASLDAWQSVDFDRGRRDTARRLRMPVTAMTPHHQQVPPRELELGTLSLESLPVPRTKRRKLRRGTHSCWECKRRKTRCTYSTFHDTVCEGCKRRGSRCVGQDLPNEPWTGDVWIPPSISERPCYPYSTLSAAWPQDALDTILKDQDRASWSAYGVMYRPYCRVSPQDMPSPKEALQPPGREAHPALIARKLLLLVTFLQGLESNKLSNLPHCRTDLVNQMLDQATSVLRNESLVDSVEGIECMMMEASFYNTSGDLRRAWLALRRAIAMAQALGVHRRATAVFTVEPETKAILDVEYLWFRLVHFDRYLSLMLGFPQEVQDDDIASVTSLERCTASERFERIACVAAGQILAGLKLQECSPYVERLLKDLATCFPEEWWKIPDLTTGDEKKDMPTNLNRLMNQLMHYYLLLQSKLPGLLGQLSPAHDRATLITSSREVLTRYVSLHESADSTYCRGLDGIAAVAGVVLVLEHLFSHCHDGCATVSNSSKHPRRADRQMVQQTLTILEGITKDRNIVSCARLSTLLKRLVLVEAEVAEGRRLILSITRRRENEQRQVSEDRLLIPIPHYGIVAVESSRLLLSPALESYISYFPEVKKSV